MMFVMATALTFDVDVDDSRSAWTIQDSCRLLVDQYEALLREREVQLPAIRVVVTSEFDSTVDFEATKLDAPLAESSLSMGGIGSPHGKTIRNPGWTAATVVAKVPNQRLDVGQRMGLEKVISHELAHVAYGAVERDAIGVREEFPFTYPLAALLAVQGAEEYRVERIGQKVLEFKIGTQALMARRPCLQILTGTACELLCPPNSTHAQRRSGTFRVSVMPRTESARRIGCRSSRNYRRY